MSFQAKQSVCKKCNNSDLDISKAMIYGCPRCGSRLFQFKLKKVEIENQLDIKESILRAETQTTDNGEVNIIVYGQGKYSINLDSLTQRKDKMDPIIVKDKSGVMNVLFNPNT